jgi:hypothetical protein
MRVGLFRQRFTRGLYSTSTNPAALNRVQNTTGPSDNATLLAVVKLSDRLR